MKCKERTLYRPHTPQFWSQGTEPLIPNPLHCVEYCVGAALFWLPTQILICKMLIKSEIKAEKNQTWPQCAEGTGGTCAASLWRGDPYPAASQFSSNTTLSRSSSKIPLLSSWVLHPGGPKGGEGKAHSYFSRWPALSTAGSCQPYHAASGALPLMLLVCAFSHFMGQQPE